MKGEKNNPELSIIVVNYNSSIYLHGTISSIIQSNISLNYEIIVVDNNSTDDSLRSIENMSPVIKILRQNKNLGFARANNIGFHESKGEYILLLNSDTEINSEAIERLIEASKKRNNNSITGPLILNPDGTLQISVGIDLTFLNEIIMKYFFPIYFKSRFFLKKKKLELNTDWLTGACILIPRKIYEDTGGFDENFFLYYEDADLCKRVRNSGYSVHLTSKAVITHHLGKSTSAIFNKLLPEIKKSQLYYYKKNNSLISYMILKNYLSFKFSIRLFLSKILRNKKMSDSSKKILELLKGE